jgi:hypothetical protein
MFDLPAFIVDAIRQAAGQQAVVLNATALFIAPDGGVRTVNSANELAHYEYGANLASTAILTALNAIEPGKTEKQIGALLAADGQPNSVVMIAATGDRFADARLYPGDKVIRRGDKFSLTTGFKGGLSSGPPTWSAMRRSWRRRWRTTLMWWRNPISGRWSAGWSICVSVCPARCTPDRAGLPKAEYHGILIRASGG